MIIYHMYANDFIKATDRILWDSRWVGWCAEVCWTPCCNCLGAGAITSPRAQVLHTHSLHTLHQMS